MAFFHLRRIKSSSPLQIAPCAWHFFRKAGQRLPCAWHFFAIACMPSFASRDPALITLNVRYVHYVHSTHIYPTYPHSLEVRPFPFCIAVEPPPVQNALASQSRRNSRQLRFPREKMPCAGEAKLPIAKKCHAQGKSPSVSALPCKRRFDRKYL